MVDNSGQVPFEIESSTLSISSSDCNSRTSKIEKESFHDHYFANDESDCKDHPYNNDDFDDIPPVDESPAENGHTSNAPLHYIELFTCCHFSQQKFYNYTYYYLICMSIASLTGFIVQLYSIHFIMQMTLRMYFCLPVVTMGILEKAFVWILTSYYNQSIRFYTALEHAEERTSTRTNVSLSGRMISPFSIYAPTTTDWSISWLRILRSIVYIFINCSFAVCYLIIIPKGISFVHETFFMDIDGEIAKDWYDENLTISRISTFSKVVGIVYIIVAVFAFFSLIHAKTEQTIARYMKCKDAEMLVDNDADDVFEDHNFDKQAKSDTPHMKPFHLSAQSGTKWKWNMIPIIKSCRILALALLGVSFTLFFIGSYSAWTYLLDHKIPVGNNVGEYCDPMDTTECLLPFPSSFFTTEDEETLTGIRVNIECKSSSEIACFSTQ